MKQIIGIDPGSSGGIAWRINRTYTAKTPKDIKQLADFLKSRKQEEPDLIVFIEKVNIRPDDLEDPKKMFNLQKMQNNYQQIISTLILSGIDFIEVMPSHWQKGVNVVKDKTIEDKEEKYKANKQNLKKRAIQLFPEQKVTLWNCDALLIMWFLNHKLKHDPEYIYSRVNETVNKIF